MKPTKTTTLEQLIDQALADIGADRIPPAARRGISTNILAACEGLIRKRITGEFVGRAVAEALTSATQPEGFEGEGTSPSTSQPGSKRSAHPGVAGSAINPLMAHDDAAAGRRPQSQQQGDAS